MPSRDLADAHPVLADKYRLLIERYNELHPGLYWLKPGCVYRSAPEQRDLWRIGRELPGRRVTDFDGFIKMSLHNRKPALAVDGLIMSDPDGPAGPLKASVAWEDVAAWKEMGLIAEDLGLIWGGRWKMHDGPHVELPKELW